MQRANRVPQLTRAKRIQRSLGAYPDEPPANRYARVFYKTFYEEV